MSTQNIVLLSASGDCLQEEEHSEGHFLCITVHEARNLVAKDYDTASSDP
jgi:hypothetical protein